MMKNKDIKIQYWIIYYTSAIPLIHLFYTFDTPLLFEYTFATHYSLT